jgi:hypothetical protein
MSSLATKQCGPYAGGSGAQKSLTLIAPTLDVVARDRRTGKQLAKTSMPGRLPSCPQSFMGKEDAASYVMEGEMADDGQVRRWLLARLGK